MPKQNLSSQLFELLRSPDPEDREQAIAAINGRLQIPVRDFPNPRQPESSMYGVVWSSCEEEIAHTGYVFKTVEEARQAGIKGCQWFNDPQGREVEEAVGQQVDWTAESAEKPVSFFIDTEEDKFAEYDPQGNRLQFCSKCGQEVRDEGGVLVDPTGGDVCGVNGENDPHILEAAPSTASCEICGAAVDHDSEQFLCLNCVRGCVGEPVPALAEPSLESLAEKILALEQQVSAQQETLAEIARLAGQFTGIRYPREDNMKATLARISQLAAG